MIKQWEISYPYFEYNESYKDNATPWAGHKCFGYNLIKNLEPGLVVELGSARGTSFYSFCQAVKDKKCNTKLVAIDTWQGDNHTGRFGDEILNAFKSTLAKHYSGVQAGYLRNTFEEAVKTFEDHSIDILHIDGFHTYEAVSNDFNTWKSKVKDDGIILFHDISVKEADFGVHRFWEEVKSNYRNCLHFSHSHGLGILIFDDELYKLIASDFYADKIKCMQYSYQATKAELFEANQKLKELTDIKNSRYWKIKEQVKKLLGR